MKITIDESGNKCLILTKQEFDDKYIVGCLDKYDSAGKPESEVKVKIYGKVPNMKYCVLNKPSTQEVKE